MSLEATAAYIKHLREHAGISQAELARRSGTSSSQISKLESSDGEVRASLMARIVRAINASSEHITSLLVDEKATAESGRKLAESWVQLQRESPNKERTVNPEVLAIAMRLSEFQLGKWVAFGERLLNE